MRPRDTIGPRVGEAEASSSVRIPTGMSLVQAARHPRVGRGESEREKRLKKEKKKKKKMGFLKPHDLGPWRPP